METALERNNPRVARKTIRIPQLERLKSNRNEKILIHRQVSRLFPMNIDAVFKRNVGAYFDELGFFRSPWTSSSTSVNGRTGRPFERTRETDTIAIAAVVHYN